MQKPRICGCCVRNAVLSSFQRGRMWLSNTAARQVLLWVRYWRRRRLSNWHLVFCFRSYRFVKHAWQTTQAKQTWPRCRHTLSFWGVRGTGTLLALTSLSPTRRKRGGQNGGRRQGAIWTSLSFLFLRQATLAFSSKPHWPCRKAVASRWLQFL